MFSRPNITDPQSLVADYIEYLCVIRECSVSSQGLRALLSISNDEIDNNGVESSDDESIDSLDQAIGACVVRSNHCNGRYPFAYETNSICLSKENSQYKDIYTFLLLSTRLNMNSQKIQGGHDATKIFERLCAIVAKEYFGNHSQVLVFGTSEEGGFRDHVENMLSKIHIDASIKKPFGSTGRQKDGNLDIVAWIPFSDKKDGQMIAMGQCKTGENWESMLTELQPQAFFAKYTTGRPYAEILRLFFVTESFGDYKWAERCIDGGVLFDRTRIIEYLPSVIDSQLMKDISEWNEAAIISERRNNL